MERPPVLVVEGDPELRVLLVRVLDEAGYAVEAADGATDARVRATERRPALVLLDLELPRDAAWSLLTDLRRRERPPSVVGMGSAQTLGTFLRGVQYGVGGFAARPLDLAQLVSTTRRVLEAEAPAADRADERRRDSRQPLRLALHLLSERGEPLAVADLVDLSPGGARFVLLAPFETGARVRLSLDPGVTGEPITLLGEVRWRARAPEGFAHGVEFSGLTPELRERLASMRAGVEVE